MRFTGAFFKLCFEYVNVTDTHTQAVAWHCEPSYVALKLEHML